ncbi:phosphotransferase [Guptibacillus algicola]|uniref:phosphotransferase n=1 Tax=Guptibacillus algicola TaxID=225844 RepID=UPI001CD4462D|nr:phosphotransferase [Alkalihalobacillus algicola]MCA0987436.1 phosphotransferase [Alkalihalobacillus algicola]
MSNRAEEEYLAGGNVSNVYRSGETVRRDLKEGSERVHALLDHLERKGYLHSPRFLCIDEKGREVLTFIKGEAGNYPLKEYMLSDESLFEIARMLRSYHDAVSDFSYDDWPPLDNTPANHEVICHNDFAVYNIIYHDKEPVGIIDFDVAAPGPRIWDIAYTLYTCVPLSRHTFTESGVKIEYDPEKDASSIKERVKMFFEAYGERFEEDWVQVVMDRLEGICQTITRKAAEGDMAFQKMVEEGHVSHYKKDIAFVRKHGDAWR